MADNSFGIKELNLVGSGTPKIQSPNNINLEAVTVAISTNATVGGNLNVSGVITGDGSGLTGVVGSGSGIAIKHDGSVVGTAGTIDFSTNLDVSAISGAAVTITASGGGIGTDGSINTTGIITASQFHATDKITVGSGVTIDASGQAIFTGIITSKSSIKADGGNVIVDIGSLNQGFYLKDSGSTHLAINWSSSASRNYFRGNSGGSNPLTFKDFSAVTMETPLTVSGDFRVGTGATIEANGQASFAGIITASNGIFVPEGERLTLGSGGQDFRIYNDSKCRIITAQGGDIEIGGTTDAGNNYEYGFRYVPDNQVELTFNGSKKFETTNTGVSVTGNVISDATVSAANKVTVGTGATIEANGQANFVGFVTFQSEVEIDGMIIKDPTNNGLYIGSDAGQGLVGGQQNTAVGWQALYTNKGGSFNTAVGTSALGSLGSVNSATSNNTAVGAYAGSSLDNATSNTLIGRSAGNLLTNASDNTIIGGFAGNSGGLDIRNSSSNVVLSDGSGNIKLYINPSGNVGINSVAPTSKLDVGGSISAADKVIVGSGATIESNGQANFVGVTTIGMQLFVDGTLYLENGTIRRQSKLWLMANAGNPLYFAGTPSGSAGDHIFKTFLGGYSYEKFRIGADGQIGLGYLGTPNYGTSGQVLTSGGSGSAASWTTVSGGVGNDGSINTTGIITAASFSGVGNDIVTARWTLGANGFSDFTFTGPGFPTTQNDPVIYLARGQTYEFENNSGGSHPFQIQDSEGSAYTTGVTYPNGGSEASSGITTFAVPFSASNSLQYKCTSHGNMGNTIVIYPNLNV